MSAAWRPPHSLAPAHASVCSLVDAALGARCRYRAIAMIPAMIADNGSAVVLHVAAQVRAVTQEICRHRLLRTLVTLIGPHRVRCGLWWRAGSRSPRGTPSPWVSEGSRLPFHRTRTVAWAVCEARLHEDGTTWTPSSLGSTFPRTISISTYGRAARPSRWRATRRVSRP